MLGEDLGCALWQVGCALCFIDALLRRWKKGKGRLSLFWLSRAVVRRECVGLGWRLPFAVGMDAMLISRRT